MTKILEYLFYPMNAMIQLYDGTTCSRSPESKRILNGTIREVMLLQHKSDRTILRKAGAQCKEIHLTFYKE